jgi:gliding motility-associated-like protein
MKIFNRWGQMVFETSDINQGWDGKFGDRECEVRAYVYVIEYDIEERGSGISKGSLLLIR